MSEPADMADMLEEEVLLTADYPDDCELETNHLRSGNLAQHQSLVEEIDWLLKLRTKNLATRLLGEEGLKPELRPSGMAAHTSAAKIIPTRAARLRTGLRRGTLLVALLVVAAGVLASGGYLLASTPWVSSLFSAPAPASPDASVQSQPQQPAAPALPIIALKPAQPPSAATGGSQDSAREPAAPQADPNQPANPNSSSPADSSALSGLDARDLRDKGIAAYKAGNYPDAVNDLEASVNMSSDDPVAQYQLGLAYMAVQSRDHSLDDAELAFRTAISLQPKWAAAYQMLAETLMRRGYYEQAVPPALQATKLDPTMGEAWMTLGRAYSGAGNEAEATKAFAQAAKYAPTAPQQP
jgi:tetratricopeptide (TPR) repeat protein